MDDIAAKVYPDGWQRADTVNPEQQTILVLMRDHHDSFKPSGVIGYAVLDDKEHYISDLAVDPAARFHTKKLLAKVFEHCQEVGGEWLTNARETTSLKLLQKMEKQGRVKLTYDKAHDVTLADGDISRGVKFEFIESDTPQPKVKEGELTGQLPTVQANTPSVVTSPNVRTWATRMNRPDRVAAINDR